MPDVGEPYLEDREGVRSPLYVQPSLVSLARVAAKSPQAMGTRDTAAVNSATAMRVLDAMRRAYRRGQHREPKPDYCLILPGVSSFG